MALHPKSPFHDLFCTRKRQLTRSRIPAGSIQAFLSVLFDQGYVGGTNVCPSAGWRRPWWAGTFSRLSASRIEAPTDSFALSPLCARLSMPFGNLMLRLPQMRMPVREGPRKKFPPQMRSASDCRRCNRVQTQPIARFKSDRPSIVTDKG
jgi:hypothetical protein